MVDLPGPTPLRRMAAAHQPQRSNADLTPRKAAHRAAGDEAPQLLSVAGKLAAEPAPLDHARIAALRDAIASGTYSADPDQIARALLGKS